MLTRSGCRVDVHPRLEGRAKRPDFRVATATQELFLEAAVVFSGIVEEGRNQAREGWILDALDGISQPNFSAAIEFETVGTRRPRRVEVRGPVSDWLDSLDPDVVEAALRAGGRAPEHRFAIRDWAFVLSAFPKQQEYRGPSSDRLIAMGPPSGGPVNDREKLLATLDRKKRQCAGVDAPVVIAVLALSTFFDARDVEHALFGLGYGSVAERARNPRSMVATDGFLLGRNRGPRSRRVTAVLAGLGVTPWRCATDWPELWMNPWASEPMPFALPFPRNVVAEGGALERHAADRPPHEVLALPRDWPGPESAFEDE